MRNILLVMTLGFVAACGSNPPEEQPIVYRQIPDAWLEACTLPPMPEDTADLSDAFVQAYKCGELGNEDKERIRDLVNE